MKTIISIIFCSVVLIGCNADKSDNESDSSDDKHIHPSARFLITYEGTSSSPLRLSEFDGDIYGTIASITEQEDENSTYHAIISIAVEDVTADNYDTDSIQTVAVELYFTEELSLPLLVGHNIHIELRDTIVYIDRYYHAIFTIDDATTPMLIIYEGMYGGGSVDPEESKLTPSFSLQTWVSEVAHNSDDNCHIDEYSVNIVQNSTSTELSPTETTTIFIDDNEYLFSLHRHYTGVSYTTCADCCPSVLIYSIIQKTYLSN